MQGKACRQSMNIPVPVAGSSSSKLSTFGAWGVSCTESCTSRPEWYEKRFAALPFVCAMAGGDDITFAAGTGDKLTAGSCLEVGGFGESSEDGTGAGRVGGRGVGLGARARGMLT